MIAFNKILDSSTTFREMEDDYVILPFPKYDEAQERYLSYCHDDYSVFGIPVSAASPERSFAVLELMNELSYRYVLPAYYEIALKDKYSRDEATSQMIDILYDGLVFDIGWIYSSALSNFMNSIFRDLTVSSSANFTSSYQSMEKVLEVNLSTLMKKIDKIGEN